jgi:hypothetical protein
MTVRGCSLAARICLTRATTRGLSTMRLGTAVTGVVPTRLLRKPLAGVLGRENGLRFYSAKGKIDKYVVVHWAQLWQQTIRHIMW